MNSVLQLQFIIMAEDVVQDSTDPGTLRPNEKAFTEIKSEFFPMEIPPFAEAITIPPGYQDDSFELFLLYYTPKIIDMIVLYTNSHIRTPQKESFKKEACTLAWRPTTRWEIYQYYGIRLVAAEGINM